MPGGSSLDARIVETLPLLNNENTSFWGTSNPTYLAAGLTFAYLALQDILHPDTPSSIADFSLESPFHHVVPCDISALPPSKLIYNVAGKPTGYGFIHSGFAFGGSRFQESLYPDGKKFAPHDASSFVKEWTLPKDMPNWTKIGFSTLDLAYSSGKFAAGAEQYANWQSSADSVLPSKYTTMLDIDHVRPGDLWVMRRNVSEEKPLGTSGHTGIITNTKGTFAQDQVEILTANRDMPHMEGIGLQHLPNTTRTNEDGLQDQVFYLRPNASNLLHEPYSMDKILRDVDEYVSMHPEEYVSVFAGDIVATEAE